MLLSHNEELYRTVLHCRHYFDKGY